MRTVRLAAVGLLGLAVATDATVARDLGFEDRVRAQAAIESIRHAHRLGDVRPFEQAVPRALIERQVHTYLANSWALEHRMGAPVTASMLKDELERVARSTRMPERLRELFAALGNDAFLIQECLIRPILTERLLRRGGNAAAHDTATRSVEADSFTAYASETTMLPHVTGSPCSPEGGWRPLPSTPDSPSERALHTAIWTGNEMIIWGGANILEDVYKLTNTGGRYDPALDAWTPTSMVNAPSVRVDQHIAVWTGARMIVWGGRSDLTGGQYDPVTDTWTATSLSGAPAIQEGGGVGVWTGSRMLVWGLGYRSQATGAQYDPATNAWTPISLVNNPSSRYFHTAVWTGTEMIVWGGSSGASGTPLSTGGRYNPATDVWTATTLVNAPTARSYHTGIWTGTRMIVWGGEGSSLLDSGGSYDPVGDVWTPTSTTNAPAGRLNHTAVWAGGKMLIWGGANHPYFNVPPGVYNSGGIYDPDTDAWLATAITGAPPPRRHPTSVFDGDEMIVWGGELGYTSVGDGGVYCACATTTYHRDEDGDGFGDPDFSITSMDQCGPPAGFVADASDCDDADPSVWGSPSEVAGLTWSNAAALSWSPPGVLGGSFVSYDLLRSQSASDFNGSGICITTDTGLTTATDLDEPAVGSAFHYLVRAQSACPLNGEGLLGTWSDGTPRLGRPCP